MKASEQMMAYFKQMDDEVDCCLTVATEARKKGFDPEDRVDIRLASSMAERVEGLISSVAPKLIETSMAKRIKELEKKYTPQSWEISLLIAGEVAKEKFCKFKDRKEAIEIGIRVGMAYNTAGIVAAPLEGFIEANIKKRKDGKEYLAISYAGPIRGAGGTAAAVSVIISDYVRTVVGLEKYDPTEKEVKRYVREIYDYNDRVTNLQYLPSEKELDFLVRNLPVEVAGDPTEKIEVSNYKDLERVETNLIRGGMCLVVAEGVSQKAPKLWKRLSVWGNDFGVDWAFLSEFLSIQKQMKAKQEKKETKEKITPNYTFVADLVAGRPVFSYPLRRGGFRLRYGRSRTSGYSASSINPATMWVLNSFIGVGTQLKVERPGKAAAITPCDGILGPVVKLDDDSVVALDTEDEAKRVKGRIKRVLYLGDILFNYGDFSENNHSLVPAGYCPEWWALEAEKATVEMFGSLDFEKLAEVVEVPSEVISKIIKEPLSTKITFTTARKLSEKLNVALHPHYLYFWTCISISELTYFADCLARAKVTDEGKKIIFYQDEQLKVILEKLGLPHSVVNQEFYVVLKDDAKAILFTLGNKKIEGEDVLEALTKLSGVTIKDKAGTFIGARMGRPEKAKMRKLTGSPHCLFPVGDEGGRLRSFQAAVDNGTIESLFPVYYCKKCDREEIYTVCNTCGGATEKKNYCKEGMTNREKCSDGFFAKGYRNKKIEIKPYFDNALKKVGMKVYPEVIKGVRGTSNKEHIPENLLKGILRAKHNIYVNKDGTTRYDMTELPMTHFKPEEIKTKVSKLRELGYEKDIYGKKLEHASQILELKPQDLVLPCSDNALEDAADKVFSNVAGFVDELLIKHYNLKPYYNLRSPEDLVGHLVIGLAPHISAGMIGRIIGFSETQGCFAHPLYHAALRRDCDGDENCVMLLMDAFLNFSRQFLPDKRGSRTMDSPLVLTSRLEPSEVDDMAHGLDIVWEYNLDFYNAAAEYKSTRDIKVEQIKHRLGKEGQFEKMGFTHSISNINKGVLISSYKILPTMQDKLKGQMALAEIIDAVNVEDVASSVIEKHFLKDIKGNLKKFSQQVFRCVKCNEKFRRPPLMGKCKKCGGKIIFTISEGSIGKYLEPSISLAKKYGVSPYMTQTLELTKRAFEEVFGKETERQSDLGDWFG